MSEHDGDGRRVPPPHGAYAGLPYDWRRPSRARSRARLWNPDDPRVLTPKSYGWGWAITSTGWRTRCGWPGADAPADRAASRPKVRP